MKGIDPEILSVEDAEFFGNYISTLFIISLRQQRAVITLSQWCSNPIISSIRQHIVVLGRMMCFL